MLEHSHRIRIASVAERALRGAGFELVCRGLPRTLVSSAAAVARGPWSRALRVIGGSALLVQALGGCASSFSIDRPDWSPYYRQFLQVTEDLPLNSKEATIALLRQRLDGFKEEKEEEDSLFVMTFIKRGARPNGFPESHTVHVIEDGAGVSVCADHIPAQTQAEAVYTLEDLLHVDARREGDVAVWTRSHRRIEILPATDSICVTSR